jgi:hypothetical protein
MISFVFHRVRGFVFGPTLRNTSSIPRVVPSGALTHVAKYSELNGFNLFAARV